MKHRAFLIAMAMAIGAPEAGAQEALTLDRAVETALAANASLRASRATGAETAARAAGARASLLPRVSFSEAWQRTDQPVAVFSSLLASRRFAAVNFAIDALNHPAPTGFFRASAGAEQLIFDGGGRRSGIAAAALQHDAAEIATEQMEADLACDVTRMFGRVLTAQAMGRATDAALASAREDLASAERRRDAGSATEADVLSVAVLVADLRQRAIQADGDATIARAELNRLMGAPVERAFRAIEPPSPENPARERPDLARLFAEADRRSPELRKAQLAERLAETGRRVARAALLPRITAQAAIDVSGTRFDDRASAWLVGAELRWTLSTGGAELAQRKAAAAAADRAVALREDARAAVHVDVIAALQRQESALARQSTGRAALDQARESQRIIRDRFDAGLASVNDVLRAATAVLDADANQTSAAVDVIVSGAMLRRALGRTR